MRIMKLQPQLPSESAAVCIAAMISICASYPIFDVDIFKTDSSAMCDSFTDAVMIYCVARSTVYFIDESRMMKHILLLQKELVGSK